MIPFFTYYLMIGMMICASVHAHPAGEINIQRLINTEFPPEKHEQARIAIILCIVLFWPMMILVMKGRF